MFSSAAMPKIWTNGARPSAQDPPLILHKSNFKSALEHIAVPDDFLQGLPVFRVTYKGKLEPATLSISHDKFIISVVPRVVKVERVGSSSRGLMRPSILSRGRSGTSLGSTTQGSSSIGTNQSNSVEGLDAAFSTSPHARVDIGSIDRILSGQNTLLFEKARWVQ